MTMPLEKSNGMLIGLKRGWYKHLRAWLNRYEWQVVATMWIAAMILGYRGFQVYYAELNEEHSVYDYLYLTVQLFVFESGWVQGNVNWQLQLARFLAPASTVYAAIAGIAALFRDEFQTLMARFVRNHVVICGLGRRGLLLAEDFLARGFPVVTIERDTDSDWIIPCREQGGIVIYGDASNKDVLRGAGVQRADYVIAVCGEDGVNAEIAVNCRDLVSKHRGRPLKCIAQIEDPDLCYLLKGLEFSMARAGTFRLQFFNSHIRGAKLVLEEHPPMDVNSPGIPHLLIVGIGRMGENVAVRAAKMWRNLGLSSRGRLRITLIDRNADDKRKLILLKNPLLGTVCELSALTLDVHSSGFFAGAFLYDNEGACDISIVYVCLDSDAKALAAALALLKHLQGRNVPIVVRTSREGGLSKLVQGTVEGQRGIAALRGFGLLEKTCKLELVLGGTHEILAQAMFKEHVARGCFNRLVSGGSLPEAWYQLPEQYQEAYRTRADNVGEMLNQVGCTLETLAEWDTEIHVFSPNEEEILAKWLHDHVMAESHNGTARIPPGFGGMKLDQDFTPVRWKHRLDSVKEAYRNEVRSLPGFLCRLDLQICRLE